MKNKTIEDLFQEKLNSFIKNKVLTKEEINEVNMRFNSFYLPIISKFNVVKEYFLPFKMSLYSNYDFICLDKESLTFEIKILFRGKIYSAILP